MWLQKDWFQAKVPAVRPPQSVGHIQQRKDIPADQIRRELLPARAYVPSRGIPDDRTDDVPMNEWVLP